MFQRFKVFNELLWRYLHFKKYLTPKVLLNRCLNKVKSSVEQAKMRVKPGQPGNLNLNFKFQCLKFKFQQKGILYQKLF